MYRDAKRAVADRAFEVDAEYAAIVRLAEHFVAAGAEVVLVNTPESPLMLADYEDSPYYDAYRGFFSDLAERLPSTRFVDLSEALEVDDFNDLHHPTFVGAIELGPVYADLVAEALRRAEP